MRTAVIPVSGMHCDGCTRTLSLALKRLDGIVDAKADLGAGEVSVRFDDSVVSEDQVRERIEATGFEVVGTASGEG